MSADDSSLDPRKLRDETSGDGWALPDDLAKSSGYLVRRSARIEKPPRPAQRESLDDALRNLFRDCPVPPRLEQFIRDLEDQDPGRDPS